MHFFLQPFIFFERSEKNPLKHYVGIFEHTIELYFSFFADLYVVLRFEYILLKTIQQMFCQVVTYLYHQVSKYSCIVLPLYKSLIAFRAQSFPSMKKKFRQNENRGFVISTGTLMENLPEGSAPIRHY